MEPTQHIVIQATSTESLSQNDPAPGPASILTGLHPGKAILMNTELTEVPTVITMRIIPSTIIMPDIIMELMILDIEDTMISHIGLLMPTETTTTTSKRIQLKKMAMTTSGDTIPDTIPVLMMTTEYSENHMVMTLTGTVSIVSSLHTVCIVPTVNIADGAASAHVHNRARFTEASPT